MKSIDRCFEEPTSGFFSAIQGYFLRDSPDDGGAAPPASVPAQSLTPLQAGVLQILKCHNRTQMLPERAKTYKEVYESLKGVKVRDLMIKFTPPFGVRYTLENTMSRSDFSSHLGYDWDPFSKKDWQRKYAPATEEADSLVREYTAEFEKKKSIDDVFNSENTAKLVEIKGKLVELGPVFQSTNKEPIYRLRPAFKDFLGKFEEFADFLKTPPNNYRNMRQDEFDLWTAIQPLAIAYSGDFPCRDESPEPLEDED